ncbi:DJ-1/PfpI family protein [Bacillus sp. 3255]|uniref:DJ-1/PfpI family protein n=1 Tax=Bacillus sp. 3255 TaxID=2817904 RepID=UPI0028606899|nr:DJ-1/PfpI family protein [Bacillus sp. 3255]MDR6884020.1 putative intracellular protease/amidase [Bacillus sp. 3255]
MLTVQIVLFDGFDLMDAIAPYEVFCAAGAAARGTLHVEFVAAEGAGLVTSGVNGLKIEAQSKLSLDHKGIILVPGAAGEVEGDSPDAIPVILNRAVNTALTGILEQALQQPDIVVATVCGGSLVLAMGGLLEGRPAVTHHMGMGLLEAAGALPVTARVVDDGNLVTGGGVTSGLDVALHLVERELGPRIAHAVERLFEYERRGTVWRNHGIVPRSGGAVRELPSAPCRPQAAADNGEAPAFDGEWDATITTPVGKLEVKLRIRSDNGILQGTATMGEEVSPFLDPELDGRMLRWSLRIMKPMRLNLKFEAEVDGDRMTGTAKVGVLPVSKLTGKRVWHEGGKHE